MYLIISRRRFPNHELPVVSYLTVERRDDAMMIARCRRDDIKGEGHDGTVEVHRLDEASLLQTFNAYAGVASPSRKRGCRR